MPYKDKEKQKAAQRKYDKKRRGAGKTHKIWWGYGYEESMPENWRENLIKSGYEGFAIQHDKDVDPTGEIKKAHFHIVVRFSHAITKEAAIQTLPAFGILEKSIQHRDSWTAVARYLTHMDNPDKAQYAFEDIIEFGGADYRNATSRTSDKYYTIKEMMCFVEDCYKRKQNVSFSKLLEYAKDNNETWFMALCDNSAFIMREYLKDKKFDVAEVENKEQLDSKSYLKHDEQGNVICPTCGSNDVKLISYMLSHSRGGRVETYQCQEENCRAIFADI